jgi:glyoxylate carboligase
MDAVVSVLEDEGVRVAFGVPGAAILPLYEALYEMNFEVDLAFEGLDGHAGVDHVALMRSLGADGIRVTEPDEIRPALKWATRESQRRRLPILVEIMTEREESAAMGTAIDSVCEPDEIRTISGSGVLSRRRLNLLYWRNVSGAQELGTHRNVSGRQGRQEMRARLRL